jgi:quinol monooxygenase YgiN
VKPGQLESFRALMAEMVESTQAEPGALIYEWSISDEASVIHLYERFADSAATLTHLAAFGEKFALQFLAAVDPTRLVVYGTPSDEVKGGLSAFGPVYTAPFGGFAQ